MASAAVSTRVTARSGIGRFIADCEGAATATVLEAATDGSRIAAGRAPKRTGALAASIKPFLLSRTSAVWGSSLKYALPQETGSVPHDLPSNVSFFWEREGRMWMAPDTYQRVTGHAGADPIKHPGNPATHYLRGSYSVIKPRLLSIAKKHYPG